MQYPHMPLGMAGKDTRKKRIHPTKAQLIVLESSFQACPKPSSKARQAISENIQLNERCVQIWFQNRRARAKKMNALEKLNKEGNGDGDNNTNGAAGSAATMTSVESLLDADISAEFSMAHTNTSAARRFSMPELTTLGDSRVKADDEKVGDFGEYHFQATSIAIGTWRRVSMVRGDLVCSFNPTYRTLRWLVIESTYGFQLEFPLSSVLDVSVTRLNDLTATVTIEVSIQPTFSKEVRLAGGQSVWVPCQDFTEGGQASTCRRHILFTSVGDPAVTALIASIPSIANGPSSAVASPSAFLHRSSFSGPSSVANPIVSTLAPDFGGLLQHHQMLMEPQPFTPSPLQQLQQPQVPQPAIDAVNSTVGGVRRQSCPNLVYMQTPTLLRHSTPNSGTSTATTTSPISDAAPPSSSTTGVLASPSPASASASSSAIDAHFADMQQYQRARSSSLSGLEMIFQTHSMLGGGAGAGVGLTGRTVGGGARPMVSTGSSPMQLPMPIMEVPEPMSPNVMNFA
ncbi:hypothetical protein HK101_004333 [Irineochytrium annulatum]|nr:hypothetical protein HK101_004333 [Irineochytrium annulatum]